MGEIGFLCREQRFPRKITGREMSLVGFDSNQVTLQYDSRPLSMIIYVLEEIETMLRKRIFLLTKVVDL